MTVALIACGCIAVVVTLAAIIGAYAPSAVSGIGKPDPDWSALAEELGAGYVTGSARHRGAIVRDVDGQQVMAVDVANPEGNYVGHARVTAYLGGGLPASVAFTPGRGGDVETGDPGFDTTVHTRGPKDDLLAMLDAPTRAAIAAWIRRGGVVQDGNVRLELRFPTRDALRTAFLEAAGLARVLRAAGREARNVLARATSDGRVSLVESGGEVSLAPREGELSRIK